MKLERTLALLVGLAFVAGGALGCGGKPKPDGMPELYGVKIIVTQNGAPLADAALNLSSVDGSSTWAVGGKTDANGVATLTTHGDYKGAPAGTYKVAVVKTDLKIKEGAVDDEGNPFQPSPEQLKNPALLDARFAEVSSTIPDEYANPRTTPLEATISAESSQEITLDVPAKE